jgi:hypothetical protein
MQGGVIAVTKKRIVLLVVIFTALYSLGTLYLVDSIDRNVVQCPFAPEVFSSAEKLIQGYISFHKCANGRYGTKYIVVQPSEDLGTRYN